jgi:hypothetical protein
MLRNPLREENSRVTYENSFQNTHGIAVPRGTMAWKQVP